MNRNSSSNSFRQEQNRQFGARLIWARTRAGFESGSKAIRLMKGRGPIVTRTYYSHEAGEKVPKDAETISLYCEMFSVSRDFLLFGTGPEAEEFTININRADPRQINDINEVFTVPPSQFHNIRYISILTASEVKSLLKGERGAAPMSSDQLPAPAHVNAGPQAYSYQIPPRDTSMIGDGPRSFHPGDYLVIDPERVTMPGEFMLVWLEGWSEPVLRQLQSSRPFDPLVPHYDFTLVALNPSFEPVKVSSSRDVEICGRLVHCSQSY